MKAQFLSHTLNTADAGFPGEPTLTIETSSCIAHGDHYNSSILHLFNHFGTHIDAPAHFNPNGQKISELPVEQFIYDAPVLVDMPKGKGSLIEPADLEPLLPQLKNADALFIRTGLEKLRAEDSKQYAENGCAVSIDAAQYLIDHAPQLKAIGFDFISLASPANPEHGVKAHQILLGKFGSEYICIIEDMALAHVEKDKLRRVIAMPLRVDDVDSAQVSVLGESDD